MKAVVDGVCLTQNTVRHVVAVVDTVALLEHVLGFSGLGVVGAVFIDVGTYVCKEVRTVAGLLEGGAQTV